MQAENKLPSACSAASFSIPVFSRSFGTWRLSVDRSPFDQDDLASQYDRQSERWHDIIDRNGFVAAYKSVFARVLRQPRYRQDTHAMRVLDAGVGTGAMSSAFHAHIGKDFQLDAIDISSAMLQQATQRLGRQGIVVQPKKGSVMELPYLDDTFDVVLAAHVIEHLPDPHRALQEMYRVLKPGGILICSVTRASLIGAYVQLIWRVHRVSRATALNWLRQCGLSSVRVIPFERNSRARRFSLGYVGRKPLLA
ncbi:class I SAM-dependent methyltransferase [uncultured Roseobacter sp.]|uniref:class I SAM-dependent methyltransferase n=1 Tax=uncultured Roseobacter sp. TaxID=114847 RepID=UPI0026338089|nr:class I SAM-dependent methyltransferase [uncultured Roseobacter sp.]